MFSLPKIYPITDTKISGLSHLEQSKRLIDGGAKLIQLREKNAHSDEFYKSAKAVIEFAHERGVKVLINDRVDIALAANADGVHLGPNDLPVSEARKLLGDEAIIGFSTHTIEQVKEAIKFPINYLAIGPVYSTTTKENPDKPTGLQVVSVAKKLAGNLPLVAIGGIKRQNAREVLEAGADSIAVISEILTNPKKISKTLRDFKSETKRSKHC